MVAMVQDSGAGRPASQSHYRATVVDEKNMIRLWLEESVARRQLSPAEADRMPQASEADGKNWTGPFKDGLGSAKLVYKLAKDFGSWKGAEVRFVKGKTGDLVVFKGWPAGRSMVSGTRYRVDNPKIIEMQIGKPGLQAAARDSARFGLYLVVAVDVADYLLRSNATLGQLLGSMSVDIPSVILASAIGAAAGTFMLETSIAGLAIIGTFACGPLLVAFGIGIVAGIALSAVDAHFHLSEKLGEAYDRGLEKLRLVSAQMGASAEQRYRRLANSQFVHDLSGDVAEITKRFARDRDWVRGELVRLW